VVRRVVLGFTTAVVTLIASLTIGGLPAQAKPTPAELQKQIDTLNNQIETIVEQYNLAEVKYQADQTKLAAMVKAIGPQQLNADVATKQLGGIAAQMYMSGYTTNHSMRFILAGGDTSNMLNFVSTLDAMAHQQKAIINGASDQVKQYKSQQNAMNALVLKDKALVATIAVKKKTINTQLAAAQKLQSQEAGAGGGGNVGSGPYTKAQLMPHACPAASGSGKGYQAAVAACNLIWQPSGSRYTYLGHAWVMYKWGAAGPYSYDCSGLVEAAWKSAGVSLAHSSYTQHSSETTKVSKANLQVGDLVFYNSYGHVAIYVGGGYIVQAEHTGAPIMMSSVNFESADSYGRVK
jgi:cell wall-associated NlpC family hydrolase